MKEWQWMASTTESTLVIQLHLKLAEQHKSDFRPSETFSFRSSQINQASTKYPSLKKQKYSTPLWNASNPSHSSQTLLFPLRSARHIDRKTTVFTSEEVKAAVMIMTTTVLTMIRLALATMSIHRARKTMEIMRATMTTMSTMIGIICCNRDWRGNDRAIRRIRGGELKRALLRPQNFCGSEREKYNLIYT